MKKQYAMLLDLKMYAKLKERSINQGFGNVSNYLRFLVSQDLEKTIRTNEADKNQPFQELIKNV